MLRARPDPIADGAGRLPVAAAALLGAALLALNVYRAATQSITHDEALTFHWYVAAPLSGTFTAFEANNHVLHTLLAWCSVRVFGLSELTLRLPSLLGGALCLGSTFGLLRELLGRRWLFPLAFALLALNPLLLDFLSAARGYGLALGLMLFATLQLVRALADESPGSGRLAAASLATGLSVAANLTLAPECVGLLVMALFLLAARAPDAGRGRRIAALLGPGAVAAAALLAGPLLAARGGAFFVGLPTLAASSLDLVTRSLAHHEALFAPGRAGALLEFECKALAWLGVPLLLATLALRLVRSARDLRAGSAADRALLLVGGTLLLALLQLVALRLVAGLPWPADRTGLALIALGSVCAAMLARDALDSGRGRSGLLRLATAAPAALLGVLVVQMAAQLQVSCYDPWRDEAGLRAVFERIAAREEGRPAGGAEPPPVQVAIADWRDEPVLNFYRVLHRAHWMATVTRDPPGADGWDYLVSPPPLPDVAQDAAIIFTEPLTGRLLAVPHDRR